jgi:hypothetical protein
MKISALPLELKIGFLRGDRLVGDESRPTIGGVLLGLITMFAGHILEPHRLEPCRRGAIGYLGSSTPYPCAPWVGPIGSRYFRCCCGNLWRSCRSIGSVEVFQSLPDRNGRSWRRGTERPRYKVFFAIAIRAGGRRTQRSVRLHHCLRRHRHRLPDALHAQLDV